MVPGKSPCHEHENRLGKDGIVFSISKYITKTDIRLHSSTENMGPMLSKYSSFFLVTRLFTWSSPHQKKTLLILKNDPILFPKYVIFWRQADLPGVIYPTVLSRRAFKRVIRQLLVIKLVQAYRVCVHIIRPPDKHRTPNRAAQREPGESARDKAIPIISSHTQTNLLYLQK